MVDEDHWSRARGAAGIIMRSGGGHGDRELLARAQARGIWTLTGCPLGAVSWTIVPGGAPSGTWTVIMAPGAAHYLCHGSL